MDAQSPKDDVPEELAKLVDGIPNEIDIDEQTRQLVGAARRHRKSETLIASLVFRGARSIMSQRLATVRAAIYGRNNAAPARSSSATLEALKAQQTETAIKRTKERVDLARQNWGKMAAPFQGEKPLWQWTIGAADVAADEQLAQGVTTARRAMFVKELVREAKKRTANLDARFGDVLSATDGDYIYAKTEGSVVIKKPVAA
jgi:hypothetical protein